MFSGYERVKNEQNVQGASLRTGENEIFEGLGSSVLGINVTLGVTL